MITAVVGEEPPFGMGSGSLVELRVGLVDLMFALALAIGVFGALLPALRAARLRPVDALRKG
jgi:ABC-type antimicrobial peptide transport system permease subunit